MSNNKTKPKGVRLPEKLQEKIREAAEATSLSESAVMRLAMERGLDIVLEKLGQPTPAEAA